MRNRMEMSSSAKEIESEVKIEDVTLFGEFLLDARSVIDKQSNEIAEKLGVIPSSVSAWENGRSFPEVERESAVAGAYGIKGIKLEEFIKVLKISKKARQMEKDTLKEALRDHKPKLDKK